MKVNLYYRACLRRVNLIKAFLLTIFRSLASYPTMLLEVFIRKNFGQRYFSLATAITVSVILTFLPMITNKVSKVQHFGQSSTSSFWVSYGSWYLFVVAFLYFSYLRWKEVKSNPSVYDFAKFSLYAGDVNPKFYEFRLFGKTPNIRSIEIFYEPLVFFVAGFILAYFGQKVGVLLMVSSIFYGLGYSAAYQIGDNYVMDFIDDWISMEEMENAFVNDLPADKTRGVRFYAHKPTSEDMRKKVAVAMTGNEEKTYAI